MKKGVIKPIIYYGSLYLITVWIVFNCIINIHYLTSRDVGFIVMFLIGCIIIGTMAVNSGRNFIDLTDAIITIIFIRYGSEFATFFAMIYWAVIGIIDEELNLRRRGRLRLIFNVCMMTIATYIASKVVGNLALRVSNNMFLITTGFVGIFLICNISLFKLDFMITQGKLHKFNSQTSQLLFLNFIISSMVAITLGILTSSGQMVGTIVGLSTLIILHYCFFIYKKLQTRNEAIKRLLKITGDMVKYGDFRDKCSHLIANLKDLIPYNVCALYTFDIDSDTAIYPIEYVAPEGMGIGDLYFDLSSGGVTAKTVREGKIYISKDIYKDKKVKLTGKLLEATTAIVLVPISIGDRIAGLITISGGGELSAFMENGIDDILTILSNQMALAIENDEIYRDIKNKADKDHLTSLFNRRAFEREIDSLVNENTPFSMVIYDIDDFKNVNDTYGHLVGDEVLKAVSDIIRKSIRKTDIPCRFGGEEIVIIFKDLSKDDAYIISDRIRDKIEATPFDCSENIINITISGGVSSFPQDGSNRDEIIRSADYVLYNQCKRKGKNRVCAYKIDMEKIC